MTTAAPARIARGFAAGLLAVLVFHQGALLPLNLAGVARAASWRLDPVPPLGVPAVASAAFWGGLWGIALALLLPRPSLGRGPARALLAGGGFAWPGVLVGPVVNGAWGLGTTLLLLLFLPPADAPGPAGQARAVAPSGPETPG